MREHHLQKIKSNIFPPRMLKHFPKIDFLSFLAYNAWEPLPHIPSCTKQLKKVDIRVYPSNNVTRHQLNLIIIIGRLT